MCVTRQNMQWYCYCPKMPRTTIRQRWSVIAFNRTGIRAPAISRRLGIPRRTVYGISSRHAARHNEVKDLPRSGRPRKGMCQQWLQTGLSWHYGGLTAQKYTDHIIGPHNEPHIDNHALAYRVVFKPGQARGFLPMRRLMSSCGQQRARISILLRTYGHIYPDKSMKWIRYLEIPLGFVQQCPTNDRASHKRASDGLVTSAARQFVPSCRLQIDMSIIDK